MRRLFPEVKEELAFLRRLLNPGLDVPADGGFELYDRVVVCWHSAWEDEDAELFCQVVGRRFEPGTNRVTTIRVRIMETSAQALRMRLGRFGR